MWCDLFHVMCVMSKNVLLQKNQLLFLYDESHKCCFILCCHESKDAVWLIHRVFVYIHTSHTVLSFFLHLHSYLCWFVFCVHSNFFVCLCLWAYIVADELISPKDIDPIHRYVPRQDQRNVSMRYSNQVSCNVTVDRLSCLGSRLNLLHNL